MALSGFGRFAKKLRDSAKNKTLLNKFGISTMADNPRKLEDVSPGRNRLTSLVDKQFTGAQSRLLGDVEEGKRSALENARRMAAIRGTSGAGFEGKIREKAVQNVETAGQQAGAELESAKAQAMAQAEQFGEGQRQFNATMDLQRYIASNEMKMSEMATFVNTVTALDQAGLKDPKKWKDLFENPAFLKIASGLGMGGLRQPFSAQQERSSEADQLKKDLELQSLVGIL